MNGVRIAGFTNHFIDRIIGETDTSAKGKRLGVPVDEVLDALMNPVEIGDVKQEPNGKFSFLVSGKKCTVSINPDDNLLVQTQPRRKR